MLSAFNEKVIKTDNQIKYDNSDSVLLINVYGELFTVSNLDEKEALAIILHEVGHNFQHKASTASASFHFNTMLFIIQELLLLFGGDFAHTIEWYLVGSKEGRDVSGELRQGDLWHIIKNIEAFFNGILSHLSSVLRVIPAVGKILSILNNLPILGIQFLINIFKKIFFRVGNTGYYGEKYSDNFVTSHGYGPEIISAFTKLEKNGSNDIDKFINRVPFLRFYIDFIELPIRFLNLMFDPHPATIYRVKDQLKMLESELSKSDLSKEAQKAIEDDLQRAQESMQVFEDKAKSKEEFGSIKTLFNIFLLKAFGGDPKELMNKTKSYDYNEK
jgi:hypothetical protein